MDKVMPLFLSFTGKSYFFSYKVLSLIPGTIVFLGITPFILFHISHYLSSYISCTCNKSIEQAVAVMALLVATIAMLALWIGREGNASSHRTNTKTRNKRPV